MRQLITSKKLDATQIGRRYRITKASVDEYNTAKNKKQTLETSHPETEAVKQPAKTQKIGIDDIRRADHFDQLAQTAKTLVPVLQKLLDYKYLMDEKKWDIKFSGNVIDGLNIKNPDYKNSAGQKWEGQRENVKIPVDLDLANDLLQHFNQLFPDLALNSWQDMTMENVNKQIVEKLSLLARSKAFKPCPECEVCKLLGSV